MFTLPKIPSFGEKFADSLTQGLSKGLSTSAELTKEMMKHKTQQQSNKQVVQDSFNRLVELTKKGNLGRGSGIKAMLGFSDTAADKGEFEASKASLVSAMRDLVNKGVLSNQKFQYIVNDVLPNSSDLDASILGKLKGVAQNLGLDSSILGDEEIEVPEKKKPKSSFISRVTKSGHVKMRPPGGGNPVWIPKEDVKAAEAAGGEIFR